jgi:hypothetical protein
LGSLPSEGQLLLFPQVLSFSDQKNLGNLFFPSEKVDEFFNFWGKNCKNFDIKKLKKKTLNPKPLAEEPPINFH